MLNNNNNNWTMQQIRSYYNTKKKKKYSIKLILWRKTDVLIATSFGKIVNHLHSHFEFRRLNKLPRLKFVFFLSKLIDIKLSSTDPNTNSFRAATSSSLLFIKDSIKNSKLKIERRDFNLIENSCRFAIIISESLNRFERVKLSKVTFNG